MLVDHPVVAFPHRLGGERTRIGTGGVGLSHRKTRLQLSIDQRKRPGALLFFGAVLHQDPRIAGVGSGHPEQSGSPGGIGHQDFIHLGELEKIESHTAVFRRGVRGPQTGVTYVGLDLLTQTCRLAPDFVSLVITR